LKLKKKSEDLFKILIKKIRTKKIF